MLRSGLGIFPFSHRSIPVWYVQFDPSTAIPAWGNVVWLWASPFPPLVDVYWFIVAPALTSPLAAFDLRDLRLGHLFASFGGMGFALLGGLPPKLCLQLHLQFGQFYPTLLASAPDAIQ